MHVLGDELLGRRRASGAQRDCAANEWWHRDDRGYERQWPFRNAGEAYVGTAGEYPKLYHCLREPVCGFGLRGDFGGNTRLDCAKTVSVEAVVNLTSFGPFVKP